jgi:hypothetical protein
MLVHLAPARSKACPSRVRGAEERLEVPVPPELLAGGVAAWGGAEQRPSPAAFTARHVCHVAAAKVGLRVAPYIGERTVGLAAGDNAVVLVFADLASTMEEHGTRILRLAERKMNTARSNG